MVDLNPEDPLAVAVVTAIQSGDAAELQRLLDRNPNLATTRIRSRSLLHIAADWPGHFPNGAAVVAVLVAAGADPNARGPGKFPETPLQWAASSDDVEVLDALIDGGAELEAAGSSIAAGTALDNAVGYGQWRVARRLVERGAKVTKLWHAAALGLTDHVQSHFAGATPPGAEEINAAFWQACHGGQRQTAEYLLARGADKNWIPDWAEQTPLDIALHSGADDLVKWLRDRGAMSAKDLK